MANFLWTALAMFIIMAMLIGGVVITILALAAAIHGYSLNASLLALFLPLWIAAGEVLTDRVVEQC